MPESLVDYDREGDVVWLTLNRPERLNAVNMRMRDDLWAMLGLLVLAAVTSAAQPAVPPASANFAFVHPGLLQSREDLDRIGQRLAGRRVERVDLLGGEAGSLAERQEARVASSPRLDTRRSHRQSARAASRPR